MIAIVNNCQNFRELSQGLKDTWWRPGYKDEAIFATYMDLATLYQVCIILIFEIETLIDDIIIIFIINIQEELMPKACKSLLDQVLCHINFDKVLGEEWLHSCDSVDSACEVVRDHFKETDTVVS